MTAPPAPARPSRAFSLAWLMATAFVKTRLSAVLAFPLAVLMLAPYAIRGQLYETPQGDGMVIFGRYRVVVEFLIVAVMMVPLFAVYVWIFEVHGFGWATTYWAVLMFLLLAGATALGQGSMTLPTGRETPRGRRWQVAALAQRPGTRLSAVQMALRLRDTLPPGAVLVASAASDELVRKYEQLGFTEGKNRRVYWISPGV
ncbi:hypothetical protein [Nesterenkonia sp. HG001]|uniref:hypothetical protein n=1 Tax=Nesterenkonia sp. HG001 TaxID=2983207 RepID=UPI002AC6E537|nr:hypothetical protein [Nesterenkonia sp. HG001]MDZ5076755.1 hypothetical protein [Nesterenkonia sp. HG001]